MAPVQIAAVQQVCRMRGGSQSQLMRCSDGEYYVVKFQNNPQGIRTLANELLATALADCLGLPVAPSGVVNVSQDLVEYSDEMFVDLGRQRIRLRPGLCFGSRYQPSGETRNGQTSNVSHNYLPKHEMPYVVNAADFAGMLVFDKWAGNLDSRQVVFVPNCPTHRAVMVDHGLCFGGFRWDFPDCPAQGLHSPPIVYGSIRSFRTFEPWLDRLEREVDATALSSAAQEIPTEWYGEDKSSLSRLLDELDHRRKTVTIQLLRTVRSFPQLFPHWRR